MGAHGDAAAVPRPIGVGPEMAALSRFCRDVTWKGTIHAGGMGPGTPAMTGAGRGKVQAIQDGRWIVLDCEQDQFLWIAARKKVGGSYKKTRSKRDSIQ